MTLSERDAMIRLLKAVKIAFDLTGFCQQSDLEFIQNKVLDLRLQFWEASEQIEIDLGIRQPEEK